MRHATRHSLILLAVIGLTIGPGASAAADRWSERNPNVSSVTGQSDWSILPPNLSPEYVTAGPDGSLKIHDMPLSGLFTVSGQNGSISGQGWGILNADLDPTLDGPIYGPLWVTATIDGAETLVWEGYFDGQSDGLLASGRIVLQGRGPFAGAALDLDFVETGANTETFHLTGSLFNPRSH